MFDCLYMQNGSGLKLSCSAPLHLCGGPNKSSFRGLLYSSQTIYNFERVEKKTHDYLDKYC